MVQTITPELRRWIVEQTVAGFSPESVLDAMVKVGWRQELAAAALEDSLREHRRQRGDGRGAGVAPAVVPARSQAVAARLDQDLPVGNEGAGVVVKAGSSPAAQALLGKRVTGLGGEMYAQYRMLNVAQVMELPAGATVLGFNYDTGERYLSIEGFLPA